MMFRKLRASEIDCRIQTVKNNGVSINSKIEDDSLSRFLHLNFEISTAEIINSITVDSEVFYLTS